MLNGRNLNCNAHKEGLLKVSFPDYDAPQKPDRGRRRRRSTKKGSLISLKILVDVKQKKLFFLYYSKNSNNFPMGLKIKFVYFGIKNSFVIYDQKNEVHEIGCKFCWSLSIKS